MTINCYVFYAGNLYGKYTPQQFKEYKSTCGLEIYNGALVYMNEFRSHPVQGPISGWYRMDWIPVLIEDVPKELRPLLLLLT